VSRQKVRSEKAYSPLCMDDDLISPLEGDGGVGADSLYGSPLNLQNNPFFADDFAQAISSSGIADQNNDHGNKTAGASATPVKISKYAAHVPVSASKPIAEVVASIPNKPREQLPTTTPNRKRKPQDASKRVRRSNEAKSFSEPLIPTWSGSKAIASSSKKRRKSSTPAGQMTPLPLMAPFSFPLGKPASDGASFSPGLIPFGSPFPTSGFSTSGDLTNPIWISASPLVSQLLQGEIARGRKISINEENLRALELDAKAAIIASSATPRTKGMPCTCKNSQCLKMYCSCFAARLFCKDCKCKGCHNKEGFEQERLPSISWILQRNPKAFDKKEQVEESNGCQCNKAKGLKKFCGCFLSDTKCCEMCKCGTCEPVEEIQKSVQQPSEPVLSKPVKVKKRKGTVTKATREQILALESKISKSCNQDQSPNEQEG